MSAAMIELEVLEAAPDDDARAAIERLGGLGTVVLLVPGDWIGSPNRYTADGILKVTAAAWSGTRVGPSDGTRRHSGPGRGLDRTAIARLEEIRVSHAAGWLIAAEATLATARACPGLRVICVGPANDDQNPTRPDHRAHSLLDAARFIETSEAFA
jgi:hypothetical protein